MNVNRINGLPLHLYGDVWRDFGDIAGAQAYAFSKLEEAFNVADGARRSIAVDDTRTTQGKLFALHELYKKTVLPAAKRARATLDKVADARQAAIATADRILAPATDDASIAMATEIRTMLRSMNDSDRATAMQKAIKTGDRRTIVAALSGPPYLSGLVEGEQEGLRRQWLETYCSPIANNMDQADKLTRLASQASPMLEEEALYGYIFDPDEARQLGVIIERRAAADIVIEMPKEPEIRLPAEMRSVADAERGL